MLRRTALVSALTLAAAVVPILAASGPTRPATAAMATAATLCFQQLSGQAGLLNIEQLRLELDGKRVGGFYHWIPWQKDRRVGRLEGRLSADGRARVLYRFLQEGQQDSARLTIDFNDRQARISWDKPLQPGQPMAPTLLPRHACGELQPVPGL